MEILQVPKARKLAEAYHDGSITLREFMEELEWCWDKKLYRGTRARIAELRVFEVSPIPKQDR